MGFKSFIVGGLIGFGFGVYYGHNYATEKYTNTTQKLPIRQELTVEYNRMDYNPLKEAEKSFMVPKLNKNSSFSMVGRTKGSLRAL